MTNRARNIKGSLFVTPLVGALLLSCAAALSAAVTDSAAATDNSAAAGNSADIPQHVQLAYVPERNTSLLELPARYWTVQVLALSSKEALEAYARRHQLQGMTAARIAQDGKLFYILLLGVYETRERAARAIENVPPPFDNLSLWLRPLGSLQAAMAAANSLSGSDAF